MYQKFYQMRVKATILYATETGRSHSYANIVKDAFDKIFATRVCILGDTSGEIIIILFYIY